MDYPVTQQDILLCTLPNRVARLKVELLTMQGQTLLELTSETIDGGLTIESESDVRRIVDLTLECINETYNFGADKRIWFDKKIGLSYGILAPDDVWHDYPLGVFAFTGANFTYDEQASQLKITAADLMAFTLQDRGSQIGASEVVIEVDSNIRNAMIETLKRFTPLVDYAITEFPADQQVVPYDVSVDSGAYPHDIIKKLRDLYPNYETYIDAYGTFVCNKIPERTDDPLFLDETVIDPLIISEQVRTDFNVRNVTEIWGAEIEPDRTMQHCSASGSVYNAGFTSDRDLEIVIQPDNIRAELDGTVYFSVNAVGNELEYQWQWSDNGTTWSNSTATGSNINTLTIKAESHRNSYLYRCVVSGYLYDSDQVPVESKSGEVITVSDASASPVRGFTLYGKTTQNGTPSPNAPIPLVTVGADGGVKVSDKAGLPEGGDEHIMIITQPRSISTPVSTNVVFSVVAKGEGLTYQWEYSSNGGASWANSTMASATSSELTVVARAYLDGYPYRCLITDKNGNKLRTNEVVLTIAGDTTVYDNPATVQTATITTASGLPGVPVDSGGNYTDENGQQWIADTIEYDADVDTAKYVRRVEQLEFDGSEEYQMLNGYFRIHHPGLKAGGSGLCSIGSVYNSFSANGFYYNATYVYFRFDSIWVNGDNMTVAELKEWVAAHPFVLYAILAEPVETDLTTSEFYALRMQNPNTTLYNEDGAFMDVSYWVENPISGSVVSDAAVLTIEDVTEKPRIVKQPQDAFAKIGGQFEFTVEAVGVSNYQWQFRYNANADWQDSTWATANDATQKGTLNESRAKYDYRCLLTGVDGTYLATNTVHAKEISSSIEIIRQPVNAKAILGEIIYFSVSAKGATGYQWQRSEDGGKTWTSLDWNGNDTPVTYTTADSALVDNSVYRCILTSGDQGQMMTDVVYAIDPTQYVYVNNERICVIPDVDSEAGQTMAIEGLAPCPIIIRKYSTDGTQIDEPIAAGVMKAGYPYVLRYMDGVFLYEGELNVHAIVKEVSALPSDEERAQDQIDNDCRTIEYVVNPESPFTVEKLGELRQVLSGGEYEDITTSQLAIERCRWENWKKTRLNDGATVTMLLLPFMEVNKKIRYTSPRTGEKLTYMVKSVSMDFSGCTMTLELVRFYPYYLWQ